MTFSRPLINQSACVICLSHIIIKVIACFKQRISGDMAYLETVDGRSIIAVAATEAFQKYLTHSFAQVAPRIFKSSLKCSQLPDY